MAPKKKKSLGKNSEFVDLVEIIGVAGNSQKSKKRNVKRGKRKSNGNVQDLSIVGDEFIPLVPQKQTKNNRRNKKSGNSSSKEILEVVDNVNEDFIEFPSVLSNLEIEHHGQCVKESIDVQVDKLPSEVTLTPVTITVDDDGDSEDSSICIDEVDGSSYESDSVNDSIQILKEMVYSNNTGIDTFGPNERTSNKRKLDDSIEICLDSGNSSTVKRARYEIPSAVTELSNANSKIQKNLQCEDDDIIVVDTIGNRNSVVELDNHSAGRSRRNSKKRRICDKRSNRPMNCAPYENRSFMQSFVMKDNVGNVKNKVPRYKSPLLCIPNKNSDKDTSYYNKYGNNMYNPNSVEKSGLRPVVIDASNVAYGHGGNRFSTRGIEICVNYFAKRGHWVVAFVPLFRRSEVTVADRQILDKLESKRQLAFTPSRFLNGHRVTPYDDRFIVQCAAELGGVIVSTDNYRDLVLENEAWRETIEKRLLMFTWVGDILMFPDDPNGRGGPRLEEFLRFP